MLGARSGPQGATVLVLSRIAFRAACARLSWLRTAVAFVASERRAGMLQSCELFKGMAAAEAKAAVQVMKLVNVSGTGRAGVKRGVERT